MIQYFYIFSVLLFICEASGKTCTVLDYGGKADNKTDLGPAVIKTYKYVIKINK